MIDRLDAVLAARRVRRSARHRPGTAPGPAPAGIERIRHVVVLMMENHSYDNYLGMLPRGDGFTLSASGAPVDPHHNRAPDGRPVPLTRAGSTVQLDGIPSQSWTASHEQWNGGRLDGFVKATGATTPAVGSAGMRYWTAADLPFYGALANTYPLATRWFCSCLGPTFPNRRFLIAATAHGLMDDVVWGLTDLPPAGTIFDQLSAKGISWANYHNKPRAASLVRSLVGRRGVWAARHAGLFLAGTIPGLGGYARNEFQFTADLFPLDPVAKFRHALPIDAFFEHARTGTLPAFSIVDPDYGTFSEEDPQDVRVGESFAADVIGAVTSGPGWPHTVLVWLYDEHGGYYDHVAPPPATPPDLVLATSVVERHPWLRRMPLLRATVQGIEAADRGRRTYDRYGFRVPAVIVSPFARPNCVADTVYDHTSILKLVELRHGLEPLTRRDAAATAPLDVLDLAGPPAFLDPPRLPAPATPGAWRSFARSG